MSELIDILNWISLTTGSFFVVVGAIGLYRMPDVYTRMHSAGIIDTVGAGLLIFGMILQAGISLVSLKLLVLLALFFFFSPVATHALSRAALHAGIEPILHEDKTTDRK